MGTELTRNEIADTLLRACVLAQDTLPGRIACLRSNPDLNKIADNQQEFLDRINFIISNNIVSGF